MSDAEKPDSELDTLAFEYVAGTLDASERAAVLARIALEPALADAVSYWEANLMTLNAQVTGLPPRQSTWDAIESAITPTETRQRRGWLPFTWIGAGAALMALVLALSGQLVLFKDPVAPVVVESPAPSDIDYIAVLSGSNDELMLTTLGNAEQQTLQLEWHVEAPDADSSLQLWAVSRRDGETRSIAVIESERPAELQLSNAHWRLITDAHHLLLTREEAGGSPIDEPSEDLLGRGLCVRLKDV